MPEFKLTSDYKPTGDQPSAIATLVKGMDEGKIYQTLLGATGTGKSLDYNEQLLVIDKNNNVIKTKIGEFVEKNFQNPQKIKNSYVQEIYGYKVLSFNSNYKIEAKKIAEVSKHKEEDLYEITLDDFSKIRVTQYHNCYRFYECKFELCSTHELKIGDYLPISNFIPVPLKSFKFLNLLEFNLDFKLNIKSLIEKNMDSSKIIKEVLKREHYAYNWKFDQILNETKERGVSIDNLMLILKKINLNLNDVFRDIKIITKSDDKLNPLIPIDEDFLLFVGLYLSEGHCTDRYILISNSDKNLQDVCKRFFAKYNLNFNQRNKNDIQFNSIIFSNFFKTLGRTAREKQISSFFYNLSNDHLKIFLRSLFDGDGWVEKTEVDYLSVSEQLVFDIKNLLLRFGITSRNHKKLKKWKTSDGNYKEGIYNQLSISGQKNLRFFYENISFSLSYKKEKLKSILGKKENTNVDLIPNCSNYIINLRNKLNLSQKELADKVGCVRQHISHIENKKRYPSKLLFKKIIKFDENSKILENILEFNLRRIIDIKNVKSSNGFVYDLSVEGNENFCSGLGNIFVHNTFTVANIIQELQIPTLVMAPNKTLAAQLYNELKELFPQNAVHYFVSYYDYYQPEAFVPTSGMYIEKDFSVNFEIQRHRLATAHALRTRVDVIVVATVSCIYGMGNPKDWEDASIVLEVGKKIKRSEIIRKLVEMGYERKEMEIRPGIVRAKGDIIDIYPLYLETALRISLFGDDIESIEEIHPITINTINKLDHCRIFPSSEFVIPEENKISAIEKIKQEMIERVEFFQKEKKYAEAQRIGTKTKFDLEMLKEMGFCKAIENYSRYLDGRDAGVPPRTLIDYFPKDFLMIVDESHITIPQIHGMIRGDISRKDNLIDFGYRLPSAYDNRPLNFEEWEKKINKIIFMSATPSKYELEKSDNEVAEQIIRPTGLVDPIVEVRPIKNQIDDLLGEIKKVVSSRERVLITTLTKRMSEDIADYYNELGVKVTYLHSEIDTVERFEILRNLREGVFDVLVGINLLREGLDLPEVSLVAILDADKQGFLRDTRSLIQTIGRASRNINGRAILYADKMTNAMKSAIDETDRRRKIQSDFNKKNNITPKTIQKKILESLAEKQEFKDKESKKLKGKIQEKIEGTPHNLDLIKYLESEMYRAASDLRFEDAAYLRDRVKELKDE